MTDFTPPPPRYPPPLLPPETLTQLLKRGHAPLPSFAPHLTDLYDQLDEAVRTFFEQDEADKKAAFPAAQATELGWYAVEGEKEYVTLRSWSARRSGTTGSSHDTASSPPADDDRDNARIAANRSALEEPAAQVWRETALLCERALGQVAAALSIPLDAFAPLLDGCLSLPSTPPEATPSLLRLFRYEPHGGVASRHADNGLLTVCVGREKGLQVLERDGPSERWVDATGPTLLVGSTLSVLSQGRVPAGVHRVEGNPRGRRSVVLALRPSTRADALHLEAFGGVGCWSPAALWREITSRRVNVNASHELRARQREKRLVGRGLVSEGKNVDEAVTREGAVGEGFKERDKVAFGMA